jgi:hypothetical protein
VTSIVMFPTGEHLFVRRSKDLPGGLKLGIHLRKGVEVSVHLEHAQASRLSAAIALICPPRPRRRRSS